MKTFRSKSGPFSQRPHFEPSEIDRICADELRKQGLYPNSPEAIRIDRFVEKRFGIVPQYEDPPDGVLGFTKFSRRASTQSSFPQRSTPKRAKSLSAG